MKKIFTSIFLASIISIVIQLNASAQEESSLADRTIAEEVLIMAYPNPAIDYIEFQASGDGLIMEVQLFDMIGNKVFAMDIINQPKYVLERRELKNGIYIYSVKDANGKAFTGRITLK
jgi:hypothetical protein